MNRKVIVSFLAVAFLVASVTGYIRMVNGKPEPEKKVEKKGPKVIETLDVVTEPVRATVNVTGKLVAPDKIEVFAEVSGRLLPTGKEFREGTRYTAGQVLLRIDDREAEDNLKAQKSAFFSLLAGLMPDLKIDYPNSFAAWSNYLKNFDESQDLPELPKITDEKEKLFISSRNVFNQFYAIKSAETRWKKFSVSAPFDGVVSQSNINPGTLVRTGQKMGEFISTATFEMETSVRLTDISFIEIGDSVNLRSPDTEGLWTGMVERISDRIDPATQSVKVFIQTSGEGLREGMYLFGEVEGEVIPDAVEISRNLLLEEKEVFLVKDSLLEKTAVQVVRIDENTAVVKGLSQGQKLLKEPFPGAFEGMKVKDLKEQQAEEAAKSEKSE